MKSEKPPFERMDATSVPPKSQYDQKLLEIREKCLPLLERLVGKFSEYKKICTALKEKRPPLEWLNKLEATCEKIQKKMTAQFFEKLDEAERKNSSNTTSTLEKANTEIVSDRNQVGNGMMTQKRSRWDVKPADEIRNDEKPIKEKDIPKDDEISMNVSPSENRHTSEKGLTVIDLTKSEDVEESLSKQKTPRLQLKENREQDLDIEIIASTAGHNPLRRVRSQTQFVTLEEVNKSPFYKKFTSDNMILDSRAANLKYGTVFDLVKSKAQSSETRHRKYSQRRCEGLSRRPSERKESWPHKRDYDYENKTYQDSFDKKASMPHNKSHVTNLVNDKTYEHLQIAVKFFDRNKESNVSTNPRWSDDSSSKTKYGKSGNEFHGKIPFYKQNNTGNFRYSYPERSFTTYPSKDPVPSSPSDLYLKSSKSFPSNQSVTNTQFNSVGFPQQACSFHCNCCKNTPYFSSVGASYQPTATCLVGNSNYAFFSGQYFPNQQVISPPNKNLPTPFPTYAVPPLSNAALAASTPPCSNANKPGYSVPVFCNEGSTSTNKTTPTLRSWNASNSHHPELSCRNIVDNCSRPKDPRTDIIKDILTQSSSNITQRLSAMDSALSKNSCFSGISEERFSQSCTFLRPDNLYRDFKCHSDDFKNNSFESLKSFGLINNGNVPSKIDLLHKLTISDSKNPSNNEVTCKINHPESNNCNEQSHSLQSVYQTDKQEETVNIQDKTQKSQDNYISPLSNLYNDSNPKFEGYNNVTNKQLENRKRKYEEVLGKHFSSSDCKRKSVGKDKPMTKLCHVENKECIAPKRKPNSEDTSTLQNHEMSEYSRVENSPRSDDTNLSIEHWEKLNSSTEWAEKDCQPQYYQTSIKERNFKLNGSPLSELLNSENILVSQKENSGKEKLMETSVSFKKLKEQKPKPHDFMTNKSKASKNTQVLEKQKSVGKDKPLQNNIPSKKTDTKKIEPNCSLVDQLQPQEKMLVSQKEKLECKVKAFEKIISSKNIDRNPEPNTNSNVQLTSSENSPVSQQVKADEKEKFPDKDIAVSRSISDKKKCTSTQTHQKDKSIEKETCLQNNYSSNKSLISNNQLNNKIVTPLKEKTSNTRDKSSEKCTSVISKNKNNYKTSKPQKGKTLRDQDKSSEKPSSEISNNKDNYKTSIPQKGKTSSDKEKNSVKPRSSKKLTKINNKHSQNAKTIHKDSSIMHEICLKNNTMLQKVDTNINTDKKSISQGTTPNPKEKCPERKRSSKKRNIDQVKDCSVVLKREKSGVKEKCADNNVYVEKSAPKLFDGTIPNKIQSHDMEIFAEKTTDSHIKVTSNPKCNDKSMISQRERTLEKERNNSEEISNYDNDKVKDLVLRMKSLSQSEALKVITEFASTLKVGESQLNINVSKDQRVPTKEEDIEQTTGQIKIKDEIIDDYPEPLKIENNVINKINDTSDSIAKSTVFNNIKNITVPSQLVKHQSLKTYEIKENKMKLTLQDHGANVKNAITDMKNVHASLNTFTESSSGKLPRKVMAANHVYKEPNEKFKFNKKKKLSELDKIHADLESCHGLDDIMKCSGLRTCRLKNESVCTLKENTIEDKQIKKRRVTASPEESFFIEDEITIKMEPIPELTFDFIKQEPDYFE